MRKSTLFQTLSLIAIGSMLGYAAATTGGPRPVNAAPAAPSPSSCDTPATPGQGSCCSSDLDRGALLALAERNEAVAEGAAKSGKKPNILVIFGDDIGQTNLSAYSMGLMGYRTPNIDRVAKEGMIFTDYYAEQSCTAGRSSFITGQCTFRTGLSKVGVPASPVGLQKEDPTIAELLKNEGYVTGQFGKNHLGDLNEYLPTVHGFDEFFGNLYHLNAEEEPEQRTYPRDPEFKRVFGPRGVLRCKATDQDDPTVDPRFGRVGKQVIEDTGALTKKRMEHIDDETSDAAVDYIKRNHDGGKPFFVWYNSTRMHLRTHVAAERRSPPGLTALTEYADGMVEHDGHVGKLLKTLDDLKLTDNTIVIYTTDNGPHMNTWPDGAMTPFRSEKNTNWEGAFRVPCMVRWPGKIKAGSVSNEIVSGHDWLPTLLAAAGDPEIKEKLLKGHEAAGKHFKVHLDGWNQLPYLTGEVEKSPRRGFFYFNDDGDLVGLRAENWKIVFMEQRAPGTLRVWAEPFTPLRLPKLFDLRADPFERADITSNTYYDWLISQPYIIFAAQAATTKFLATFKDFPPRQHAPSFSVDQALDKMKENLGSH
ncbi:arylsulfatase [Singulisphaera acidiphila]|uniref:Arylsulfatase A family protein n=1 Tax=Singulisphaera acidiphila (strain ATCC BAA-1392 / DSM 18658 / VKM B-2454 / MOB10) TaxID=886293 RepID=L0DE10_SINAD|nr:arylsulfatase [Singulisphaera acidiphila]AGA27068.1 arylsulfatase A family protein [Singulisphaera acidiphila DSM 18658]